jgi:phosphopantetheine--protein transferase-like protein
MIVGESVIGIDLVFIPEFERQRELGGESFLRRVFTSAELRNLESVHLAGLWAVKEAVIKACPEVRESLTEIVVRHDETGRPSATCGTRVFEVSIAHHGDYAVAIALLVD